MNAHIEQTIIDLRARAATLEEAARQLEAIFGAAQVEDGRWKMGDGQREQVTSTENGGVRTKGPKDQGTKGPREQKTKRPPLREALLKRIEECRGLSQPFTVDAWREATGAIRTTIHGTVNRMVARGWVRKVGSGQYERTSKFPGAAGGRFVPKVEASPSSSAPASSKPSAASQARLHVPGLDPGPVEPASVRLERALKERDEATARGHERLARILQDKVNKLQAEMEAA